jgi:hypothetical protein
MWSKFRGFACEIEIECATNRASPSSAARHRVAPESHAIRLRTHNSTEKVRTSPPHLMTHRHLLAYAILKILPIVCCMTLFATRSELPFMHIVNAVTRKTSIAYWRNIRCIRGRLGMAGLTLHLAMSTIQPVFGLGVVIEAPDGPRSGVVTGFAAHTQLLFVCVILFMARGALARRVFVTACFMAAFAWNIDMPPGERKYGLAVVKPGDVPRLVAVTLFTLGASLAFVFVVFFMARVTIRWCIAKTLLVFVTGRALYSCNRMCIS